MGKNAHEGDNSHKALIKSPFDFQVETLDTLHMAAVLPVVEDIVIDRSLHVIATRHTPEPLVLEIHRPPVYRVWTDGALITTLDYHGAMVAIGLGVVLGARHIKACEDDEVLCDVQVGNEDSQ